MYTNTKGLLVFFSLKCIPFYSFKSPLSEGVFNEVFQKQHGKRENYTSATIPGTLGPHGGEEGLKKNVISSIISSRQFGVQV